MADRITRFFASRWGIIAAGSAIGLLAPILQKAGNPGNMGICVACFERDTAGALGLHREPRVQYIRPEIPAFILGSLAAAIAFREFKARAGSAPIARFILGAFAMIGALAFLGCPWRACLRLSAGDGNAIAGLAGLAVGIACGVHFLRRGYNLGRSSRTYPAVGLIAPILAVGLLALAVLRPTFCAGGPIFASVKGPGAQHAPLLLSLGVGLAIGFLAQRTRFCTMGAIRDVILMRDTHLLSGVIALIAVACASNLALGQFAAGFAGQKIAHASHLWNFLGMSLSGVAFALAGGCPGRQLFLAGEGDGDAGIFAIGMFAGAAFAHNFALAATAESSAGPGGLSGAGQAAVLLGLLACVAIGFTMRERL